MTERPDDLIDQENDKATTTPLQPATAEGREERPHLLGCLGACILVLCLCPAMGFLSGAFAANLSGFLSKDLIRIEFHTSVRIVHAKKNDFSAGSDNLEALCDGPGKPCTFKYDIHPAS